MTSTIIKITTPLKEPAPFTFPGLFVNKLTGNLFIATDPGIAIRISQGSRAIPQYDIIGGRFPSFVDTVSFEQVTDSITLTLNP